MRTGTGRWAAGWALMLAGGLVAQAPLPRVFQLNAARLAEVKAHPSAELLALARSEANEALQMAPVSVTEKTQVPPSGDKHDFLSMGTYWWPNPDTANHLPYVRRDGQHNPEIDAIPDHEDVVKVADAGRTLALGWYLTGDERYAEHAALLLRTFFLNKATAMNPNLQFAQYIPGVNTGRGIGIIDVRDLPKVIDAVGMLAGAKSWTAADAEGMRRWFGAYYAWLTTSAAGMDEASQANNHGSWYAEQAIPMALYLGKTQDAERMARAVWEQRIPAQIDAQGMQRMELARTNSFSYSAMNLEALSLVAETATALGMDLYRTPQGSILKALDVLMPYDAEHAWPHEQISKNRRDSVCPALVWAEGYTHEAKYADALQRFDCKMTAVTMIEAMGPVGAAR